MAIKWKPMAGLGLATVLSGVLLLMPGQPHATPASSLAPEPTAFAVPAEDGYGIGECMQAGAACGPAVADSWCEAHGHRRAVAYGMGSADVTGSISTAGAVPDAVVIRCTD